MDFILKLFLNIFPRPDFGDTNKSRLAGVLSDFAGVGLTFTVLFIAQGVMFNRFMSASNIYPLSLFGAFLLGLRFIIKRGMLVLAINSLGVAIGLLFLSLSRAFGTVFHIQVMMLCMGIMITTNTLGLATGFRFWVVYVLILIVGTAYPALFGHSPITLATAESQLAVAITMLSAFLGISNVMRNYLMTHAFIAREQRDDALEALQRSNEELAALLSTTSTKLDESLEHAKAQKAEHARLLALATMISGLSHELGSPMGTALSTSTSVREWALLLKDIASMEPEAALKLIARIDAGCELVSRNIFDANRLLNSFKQVSVDTVDDRLRHVKVLKIVEYCLVSMKDIAHDKGIDVLIDVPDSLSVETFKTTLERILYNIIENAIKHGLEKKPNAVLRIKASQDDETGLCHIEIYDNGWGIDPSSQRRIFEPFFTTKRGLGSIGMGLFIAHHLAVSVLKGSIQVESSGEGTLVRIDIPLKTPVLSIDRPATSTEPASLH